MVKIKMKQEFKTGVVLQSDCLELFKTIPDNSIEGKLLHYARMIGMI
jgi:hypothetical protein